RSETGLSAPECLDDIRAACAALADRYRVPPLIYTSARVWRDDLANLPAPNLSDSPLWVSRQFFKAGPAVRDAALFAGGKFDATTEGAVRTFQNESDLVADGVIGPRTFAYLARGAA